MSDRADRIEKIEGVHYDGARVPHEIMGVLADADALLPEGLPGTLTLDGKLATVRRGEGDIVVIEPL